MDRYGVSESVIHEAIELLPAKGLSTVRQVAVNGYVADINGYCLMNMYSVAMNHSICLN